MWNNRTAYKKGIFWCCKYDGWCGEKVYLVYYPILVFCDENGNAIEELEIISRHGRRISHRSAPIYSSKSGNNFNHKIEWERHTNTKPYNYFPRGRIEVHEGKIKIFASPIIVDTPEYRAAVCTYFQLREDRKDLTWIADNSVCYQYETDECSWKDIETFENKKLWRKDYE